MNMIIEHTIENAPGGSARLLTALRNAMSANSPLWPLTQLNLYLSGYHSIECRCCQGYIKASSNGNGQKPSLAFETIQQAVSEALPLGLSAVRLCGEQPFLYPQWEPLLDLLESAGLSAIIETNGAGLTPEQVARLAQRKLPQLRVVVSWSDARPGTENVPAADAIRAASHRLDGIRRLADAGLPPQIIYPVTRLTARQIPSVIHMAEQYGAKSIRFSFMPPALDASTPQEDRHSRHVPRSRVEALSVEEIIALGYKIERQLSRTTRVRLSVDHPPAFRGLDPQSPVEGQGFCAVRNNLNILPGGVVALCSAVQAIPELVLGRIGETALEAIWHNHPILNALRSDLPDRLEGICGHCVMNAACLGYCLAENYLRSGSFYGPNWFCQSAEQVGLFPAGRITENAW